MLNDIKNANAEFYEAFENLSINMMDRIWSHNDNCICIHPGWEMVNGWLAIRESWVMIFTNTHNVKFTITNTKITVYNKVAAVVTCLENIKMIVNEETLHIGVVATNIFEYDDIKKKWLIVYHHGSHVSDYLLPPNS